MGPQINIIGSFFPSWMLCALIGIGAACSDGGSLFGRGFILYRGRQRCLFDLGILVTLVLWVTLFRG